MSVIINMVIKMLIINNVKVPLDCTNYKSAISNKLKINENEITNFSIIKKAIDSRNKSDVFFICNFVIEVSNKVKKQVLKHKDIKPYKEYKYETTENADKVIGFNCYLPSRTVAVFKKIRENKKQ